MASRTQQGWLLAELAYGKLCQLIEPQGQTSFVLVAVGGPSLAANLDRRDPVQHHWHDRQGLQANFRALTLHAERSRF